MKRIISLHTQYIMLWIPFVNCLILFVWLFNCYHIEEGPKMFRKSFLIIFGTVLPMGLLQMLLSKIFVDFSAIQAVINALFIYLIPWVLGFALIKYQRKVLRFDEPTVNKTHRVTKKDVMD